MTALSLKKSKPAILDFLLLTLFFVSLQAVAASLTKPNRYEDDEIFMRIVLRSPEQLSAFYIGREFKQSAIDRILETCYVTPIIKNKKFDVLWLELDNWEFTINGKTIKRIKKDYWKKAWKETGLPQAHQSTFGWTLMPEARDLRFDEGVGGSIVLPMQTGPFTITANFKTGTNKKGKLKTVVFEGISCVRDDP